MRKSIKDLIKKWNDFRIKISSEYYYHFDAKDRKKSCSLMTETFPVLREELQNKTVRSHYIPTGGTTIQNTTTTTCWQGCRTGTLVHRWWEGKMVQLLWKKDSWAVSYNAKHSLTVRSSNCTAGCFSK